MSTVKIKTEPPTTATTATTVDVQVKLEPSLSTGDIKLEQHTSDIDTTVEFNSDADSEEEYIKSESDDNEGDTDQSQFTITPKKQRQFICEHPGCSRGFRSNNYLKMHQHEHRLQTDITIIGKSYILTRQSLDDRWPCPISDCEATCNTVHSLRVHIRANHGHDMKQQQQPVRFTRYKYYFLDVYDFYVNGARCGYHSTIGVFICHKCKLVPECLLAHLQQKHGYDEKSIDNAILPDSAVNASANPDINQHASNSHLAAAISQPYQQQHRDIVKGWLCVTSDCGYCGYSIQSRNDHKIKVHQGKQLTVVSALVLRLVFGKSKACYFFIARIDQTSGAATVSSNGVSRHRLGYNHNGLNAQDENGDDADKNETMEASNQKKQWKCEYPNCGRSFNSADQLSMHWREHQLKVVINVHGNTFALCRQSSDDRWTCPIPDCVMTFKSTRTTRRHILNTHNTSMTHKRANSDDSSQRQQQQNIKKKQFNIHYLLVDGFYVSDTRCGYHTTTGVFMCYRCRLVPECLLTHLQQKHGYDEKSIDKSALPESARSIGSDPNGNQHIRNPHIAAAISQPYQWRKSDIVQGWLCIKSDCGYCHSTKETKNQHHCTEHRGEQQSNVPALVLRLLYWKTHITCFLVTRLDTATDIDESNNSTSQHNSDCDVEDGDELVLSDYGD